MNTTRRSTLTVLVATATLLVALPASAAEDAAPPLREVNGFPALVRLAPGDSGPEVAALQESLATAGFYHSAVDGEYGPTTAAAVIAFHKYLRLERTPVFNALDWIRLQLLPAAGIPHRYDEPDYLEIDLDRQLLFLVRGGELEQVIPISTGGGYTYISPRTGGPARATTPVGDFELGYHQLGWACDPRSGWCVYKYWAFTPYLGIHGYRNVPTYPASHGCIRVTVWDADWLEPRLFAGMPVHIWSEAPVIPPPPEPPDAAPGPQV